VKQTSTSQLHNNAKPDGRGSAKTAQEKLEKTNSKKSSPGEAAQGEHMILASFMHAPNVLKIGWWLLREP